VELDELTPVDELVKHSSSAVDIRTVLMQVSTGVLCTTLPIGCSVCVCVCAFNNYTVKKRVSGFPSPAGMSFTKLFPKFPARESLVRDIPAWDGKIANLFYSVIRISES
jgi:hypothetical protein